MKADQLLYNTLMYRPIILYCYVVEVSCKRTLEPGRCTEHEGQLFCHQCHHKQYGPHALKAASSTAAAAAVFVSDVTLIGL